VNSLPSDLVDASIRAATPIGLAALGELIAERSGVLNVGIEGAICLSALASFIAATSFGPAAGLAAGVITGMVVTGLFAVFVVRFRAQQVIAGTAISMLALGLSATINRTFHASRLEAPHVATLPVLQIPGLADVPIIGPAFAQPLPTYLFYGAALAVAWFLYRTVGGLSLRATGEDATALQAVGKSPAIIQSVALITSGMLAGLAGATLVVAQAGTFTDNMSAGRGFIAIAVVALGRWTPAGVILGSLLFGFASSLQFVVQAYGVMLPYNLALAAPYVLTLVALAALGGSRAAPAGLGRSLDASS
jgi:simple sugar transport system permease protein